MRNLYKQHCAILALCLLAACLSPVVRARADNPAPSRQAAQAESPAAGANVKVDNNVVYGTVGETPLRMDAYTPAVDPGKRPAIVLIHGGGWIFGDKSFYAPMARALAGKGFVAFSINYRLATKNTNKYPAQLDDAQRAVRWIRAHADQYNIDPQRIGALGDSAGGYLAAFLGLRDTRDNSDAALSGYSSRVQCVVDFYGPTDFTLQPTQSNINQEGMALLVNFLGKKPEEAPDLYKDASPITFVDKQAAPFLIIHGTADGLVPVDQSERLQKALKAAGASSMLILMYKLEHGFLNPAQPQANEALAEEFFTRLLKP